MKSSRATAASPPKLTLDLAIEIGITPDTAIRCAMVFGTDALFWLALQSRWDSFHAWKHLRSMAWVH